MKKKYLFVFHHGWGGDGSYFKDFFLKLSLGSSEISSFHFESFYFSENNDKQNQIEELDKLINNFETIIGIGHSIGFSKLLLINKEINFKFDLLFSFAGFVKFINSDIDLVRLELTINEFKRDPLRVLSQFNKNINLKINKDLLFNELNLLKDLDLRNNLEEQKNKTKLLHIYGDRDRILGSKKSINETLSENIFIESQLHTTTHYLPYYEMQNCLDFVLNNINK